MNTSKQINAMIALLLILLIGVGFYTVYDPFRAEATADRTQEEIADRAAKTYAKNCFQCHGKMGEGRIGPALNPADRANNPSLYQFADQNKSAEAQAYVKYTLTCGRIGTLMPPWALDQGGSLNDEQIRQLVVLITNPPKDAWAKVQKYTEAEALPEVADITAGAVATGATTPVCGQRAPATPEPDLGPVTVSTSVQVTATDNKFSITRFGAAANTEFSLQLDNRGAALHNLSVQGVKDTAGRNIETKLLPGGQSDTIRFTVATPGRYPFICTVHPADMKGTFVVQ